MFSDCNGEDRVYLENFTFMRREELVNTVWDYHGFHGAQWSIKKSQRVQLKKNNVQARIVLHDPDMDELDMSEEYAKTLILTVDMRGYDVSWK